MGLFAKCNGCSRTTELSKCARCNVALYCSRDHQKEDFKHHKRACKAVHQAREELRAEAEKLRDTEDGDLFVEGVGHFWRMVETRPYMHAKFAMVEALADTATHSAINEALREGLDALRLARSDGMGFREVIPALMLHLGKLQECYDFIKWWATCDPHGTYDWANMSLPYLDVKDADMTESVEAFEKKSNSLHHLAALTFIKASLAQTLMDEMNAQRVADSGSGDKAMPEPVGDSLKQFLASTELPSTTTAPEQREALQKKLALQAKKAFKLVHAKNKHFWKAMMDPVPIDREPMAPYYAMGDKGEVRQFLMVNARVWLQDPTAKAFVTKQLNELK